MKKIVKKIIIILIIIIVVELLLWLIIHNIRENSISYEDNYSDLIVDNDYYVTVGSSNFHSNDNINEEYYIHKLEKGEEKVVASKARITKYDKNMKLIWDKSFKSDYDSTFNSVVKTDNGYIAVGSYVEKYSQIDANTHTGLIALYDNDGNFIKKNTYQVLGDTTFNKIIRSGNDYILVGQSIYENMEVGNHISGGGIIIKINDNLDILEKNNYGGNKSGTFNDIVEVNDGYIICGKDGLNYGIVIKFKKHFDRDDKDKNAISNKIIWHRDYENTDTYGFTSIAKKDNKLYISGSIAVSHVEDEFKYDTGYVIFDQNGKLLKTVTIGGSNFERFSDILLEEDRIILIGSTNSKDFNEIKLNGEQMGLIVTYNYDDEIVKVVSIGNKVTIFNQLIKENGKYMIVGTTNEEIKHNDYKAIFGEYDI